MRTRDVACLLSTLALGLAACSSAQEGSQSPNFARASTLAPADSPLSADQRRRADQLVSAFENSTTDIQYDYAENIGDGRGVTSGRAGFTTATCDALEVINAYDHIAPDNELDRFVPELERLCEQANDSTALLPEAEYISEWQRAADDPRFRRAQDEIVDREYFTPAMAIAAGLGVRLALTRAALYDAAIQHGVGDDPDGLPSLISRTIEEVGPPVQTDEPRWLDAFLSVRLAALLNPANPGTAQAWSQSADRVECLRRLAAADNYDLHGPITFTVYGDNFSVS